MAERKSKDKTLKNIVFSYKVIKINSINSSQLIYKPIHKKGKCKPYEGLLLYFMELIEISIIKIKTRS